MAAVPDGRDDKLDFLFRDVKQSEEPADANRKRKRRLARRFWIRRRRPGGQFDVFAVILRMCYAALLVVIVVYVGNRWVVPMFQQRGPLRPVAEEPPPPPAQDHSQTETKREPVRRRGLIAGNSVAGLHVASTPPGATVYSIEESEGYGGGRINEIPGCILAQANRECLRLPDGTYVIEVVLPWNDPRLSDPGLPNYYAYRTFRRALEHASDEERMQLLEDYFVPDEARLVFIHQTDEQIYIVRQYWDVQVRGGGSKAVRALFLPKIVPRGRNSFAIGPLVTHYLPQEEMYGFDETHVLNELDFYDVAKPDRSYVVQALSRIGVAPYVTPDGRTRLFKIGINDGTFAAKVIRDVPQ